MTMNILRIDASARRQGSVSRQLNDQILRRYRNEGAVNVVFRDLANPLPQIDAAWIGANFAEKDARSPDQNSALNLSDDLIGELRAADVILIGLPIYNFGVPASLKAWVDLVARRGETFRYTDSGPVGLLDGKRVIVSIASGGTKAGSDIDFATGYLRHFLGFIGIKDVVFVAADRLSMNPEDTVKHALATIATLPLAA
jgi:FMN-dependent NADH-azoreductase